MKIFVLALSFLGIAQGARADQATDLQAFISHAKSAYYQSGRALAIDPATGRVDTSTSRLVKAELDRLIYAKLETQADSPFRIGDSVTANSGVSGKVVGVFTTSYTAVAVPNPADRPFAVAVEVNDQLYPQAFYVSYLFKKLTYERGYEFPQLPTSPTSARSIVHNAGYDADRMGYGDLISTSDALSGSWKLESVECNNIQHSPVKSGLLTISMVSAQKPSFWLEYYTDLGAPFHASSKYLSMSMPQNGTGAVSINGQYCEGCRIVEPVDLGSFGVKSSQRDVLVMNVTQPVLNVCNPDWRTPSNQKLLFRRIR